MTRHEHTDQGDGGRRVDQGDQGSRSPIEGNSGRIEGTNLTLEDGPLDRGPLDPPGPPRFGRVTLDASHARMLAEKWGHDGLGRFRCPLPGHTGTGELFRDDGEEWRLKCCTGRWRS